ncbi:MAG: UvsW [Robiginitomaculum sp.]|nr:MAG: UvsW [Robiginitomaculum sp.]
MDVYLEKITEVYIRVRAEPSVLMEMSEHFTFDVPGAHFSPAYKNKMWDGKIRLLHVMTGRIYYGLAYKIQEWCKSRDYSFGIDNELIPEVTFTPEQVIEFNEDIDCPYTPRTYQCMATSVGISRDRALFLSPTASGKSLIIYLLARYHQAMGRSVLVVVPTITLVAQMNGDFKEYNNNKDLDCHMIKAGVDKYVDKDYTISTWQSLHKMKADYFERFDVVIGDEAHNFTSKSLIGILEKCIHMKYRYGFTGTLDGSKTNKLVLEGLFGPVLEVAKTKELIADGTLSEFDIKALVFEYTDAERKEVKGMKYQEEIEWIISHERRNKFIANLAQTIPGNTLILFNFVEKHGKVLLPMIEGAGNKKVHFIHGGISGEERERIRHEVEQSDENIILASYGTFSTGTNLKRLFNLITASPSKSRVRVLQSIGRILRKGEGKFKATLYDLADDLQWKTKQNYVIQHFKERIKIYAETGFKFKIFNIKL